MAGMRAPSVALAVVAALELSACSTTAGSKAASPPSPSTGIHSIQHVVVIMQENRSFDQYFGGLDARLRLHATAAQADVARPAPEARPTCSRSYGADSR